LSDLAKVACSGGSLTRSTATTSTRSWRRSAMTASFELPPGLILGQAIRGQGRRAGGFGRFERRLSLGSFGGE
jgi:hypothetical protein